MSMAATEEKPSMNDIYNRSMKEIGLSEGQIKEYDLAGLEAALDTVKDAINNPEALGVAEANLGLLGAKVKSTSLPMLLSRKRLILERIANIKEAEKIVGIKELINKKVVDNETKERLLSELENVENASRQLKEAASQVDQEIEAAEAKRQSEIAKLDVLERRTKIWLSFFQRESVATITGAILIIIITVAQIIAIFSGVESSDILNNAFMIILGYFFGQGIRSASDKSTTNDPVKI